MQSRRPGLHSSVLLRGIFFEVRQQLLAIESLLCLSVVWPR